MANDVLLWGLGTSGQLGVDTAINRSSPAQLTGQWAAAPMGGFAMGTIKSDGTLWMWGNGPIGNNTLINYSSPVQIGTENTWSQLSVANSVGAIKNNGTFWVWGINTSGQLGLNDVINRSSPVQVGTESTWSQISMSQISSHALAVKNDGTLWGAGSNTNGALGLNDIIDRSSWTQIGLNTNWSYALGQNNSSFALKKDGSLWATGGNTNGRLGVGDLINRSSFTQIGTGTDWTRPYSNNINNAVVKTDGTLWMWGALGSGSNGINVPTIGASTPIQLGTDNNWKVVYGGNTCFAALKTDNSLWVWGAGTNGVLDLNSVINRSSPVQTLLSDTNYNSISLQWQTLSVYRNAVAVATASPTASPVATSTPTPSPSPSPSPSATIAATPTPSVTPSPTPSPSISPTVTASPTPSPSISPTVTASPTPSPSISPAVTASPTASPSNSPSPTPSESPSPTPSESPSPTPSESPSPTPIESPSPTPSESPSPTPIESPSPTPSESPSPTPSESPTPTPSESPSPTPSESPSPTPSESPSPTPSESPTPTPTDSPMPTAMPIPSLSPTATPAPTSSGYYYYLLIDCARTYNKVGRTTKTPAQIVATPNWFVGPNLCFVVVGYATGPAYDYDLDAPTSAPINGCTDPLCSPPAIAPTASTNFVTNSLLPNADGYDYYNQGTGAGSLSLTFQNSSSSAQAVFVSLFNQSTQTMLLSVNGVNYPIYAGQSFSQTITLKAGNFITIASLMPALYASSTVFGQIYVARPSQCAYFANLTPATRAVEGDEGSLDTSVVNGVSQQRNAYITITQNGDQVKVIETSVDDDNCFNTNIQGLPDVIPLLCSGYPQF